MPWRRILVVGLGLSAVGYTLQAVGYRLQVVAHLKKRHFATSKHHNIAISPLHKVERRFFIIFDD